MSNFDSNFEQQAEDCERRMESSNTLCTGAGGACRLKLPYGIQSGEVNRSAGMKAEWTCPICKKVCFIVISMLSNRSIFLNFLMRLFCYCVDVTCSATSKERSGDIFVRKCTLRSLCYQDLNGSRAGKGKTVSTHLRGMKEEKEMGERRGWQWEWEE